MRLRLTLTHQALASLLAVALMACAHPIRAQSAGTGSSKAAKPAAKQPARQVKATPAVPLRFVTAPEGNAARYRVREQLVGKDLPNDAIGNTGAVTGAIVIGSDGTLNAGESQFVVDLKPLKSDQDRRDRFVQGRILETATYPTTTLALTAVEGLAKPLPTTGNTTFQLLGNLTVKGVTKPTVWKVSAAVSGDTLKGTAITGFTFADFGITQPRVPVLLSVADSIHLEYDFNLVRQKSP